MGQAASPSPEARLKVAATIFPLYDLVRQVAGPGVDVVLLTPIGASPHTFTPRPSQVRALTASRTLFAIGHDLDTWAIRMAQELGIAEIHIVDTDIVLRKGGHGNHLHAAPAGAGTRKGRQHIHEGAYDPHYWLSIANAMRMVQSITQTLSRLDPAAASDYEQRAAAYLQQLQEADLTIRQRLAACPRRAIALFHSAFDYFAEAYRVDIVAVFEEAPGREPSARHMQTFLQRVKTHRLSVLFIEPQLPESALRSLASDLGVTLRELDPLGGQAGRDSYLAMMHFNASQIATVLCD